MCVFVCVCVCVCVCISAVFEISIRRCIITEIWRYEYRYSWPCIDIVAHVQQCEPRLIWIQEHRLKRRNPRNRATQLRNTEISARCDTYFCQPGNHMYARSLHWINALAFWKHRLASSLAISTSIFYYQKSEIQCSLMREREREREREGEMLCMYEWPLQQ